MRRIAARHDQRRNLHAHQVLGLATWRGVAVEQRAGASRDDQLVPIDVLFRVDFSEGRIALDHGGPSAAARIGAKRFAGLLHQRDDRLEECPPPAEYWDVPVGGQTEAPTVAQVLNYGRRRKARTH
jgi:hypothetical protein